MARYPELQGKTALVTGANTGIGEAVARRFAEQGARVAVVGGRRAEAAERVAEELREAGAEAVALSADLTRGAEVARVCQAVEARFGQIDILVNSAGGFGARLKVVETSEEDWDHILALNLKTAFLCSKAVLPGMVERRWGRIINISSEAGRMPVAFTAAHYAASKAGLLGFTRHLAREVAASGVTVNATAPGTTYSDRVRGRMTDESERAMVALTPLGRIAEVDEQTGIVLFLASDEAAYITGATVDVSGGKVML
ncbi:MAG: 3-oxoacyl-ACP reductase FabG [Chloroflexi bacterium]|nr:3-oxoacyl-ACP reductase FabG [Chloroflexota bacterium]